MIEDIRRDSVTCVTEQGVGDTFWTYQKISPFYKEINFILGASAYDHDGIQRRAEGMVTLLPKVKTVRYEIISSEKYNEMCTQKKRIRDFLDQGIGRFSYTPTQYFREGIRMEEIEPGLPIAWNVPLPTAKVDLPFDHYICLTASGPGTAERRDVWPPYKYLDLIKLLKCTYDMPEDFPVVALGASFDDGLMIQFDRLLNVEKTPHRVFVGRPFQEVFYLLKNSTFFIGYQSGLNVIADNLNVPQLMIWFNDLTCVPFTFPKRTNIVKGIYNATFFNRSLDDIVNQDIRIQELPGGFKRN